MTTTMVETDLRTEALAEAVMWIRNGFHSEADWALRCWDGITATDRLSFAAIICTVAGYELNWGPVGPDQDMGGWPDGVTHAADLAYDPSSEEWLHVGVAARHFLDLDAGSFLDFLLDIHPGDGTVPTTDDVLAAINTHLIGGN